MNKIKEFVLQMHLYHLLNLVWIAAIMIDNLLEVDISAHTI